MCGIFGYVGTQNPLPIVLEGLKRLEYRGYDSSGVGGLLDGKLKWCKEVGKIVAMESAVHEGELQLDLAIGHTRWATHGKPTQANAHPHCDTDETMALVHNGIIENHEVLREQLKSEGVTFRSETDTEVLVQLIAHLYKGDPLKAVQEAVRMVVGSFAIAVVHQDAPDQMIVAACESPLAIGIGNGEAFVSSDTNAFLVHTRDVVFLSDSEVAVVRANSFEVFDETAEQVMKQRERVETEAVDVSKGDFEHFTLKEIYEQPQTIRNALLSRFLEEYGTASLEGFDFDVNELLKVNEILILGCGTSWHAGCVASYMLEDMARIPCQVEIASEFRYKNPVIRENTFVIAISQSGETADTLAAMREVKAKGAKVLGICNVHGSTLAREADGCLLLRAGPEIGVASTKAFTSQLVVLSLFTLLMARMRHMGKAEGQEFLNDLKGLPEVVQRVLNQAAAIEAVACRYAKYESFCFIGRQSQYPTALEAALKLKEITYINASGYPAGELKHGPIALINEEYPTVALCANELTYEKLLSNMMEIKARSGPIIAIASEGSKGLKGVADDVLWVPKVRDALAPIPTAVVVQLFAYYVARERGAEIDQPRNLAKSVTVE